MNPLIYQHLIHTDIRKNIFEDITSFWMFILRISHKKKNKGKKIWFICFFSSTVEISTEMYDVAEFNSLRPRQYVCHFADAIFKYFFFNENWYILIQISLKYVHKGSINKPSLVQIMARRQTGDKPLSELMMTSLQTHMHHSASMS